MSAPLVRAVNLRLNNKDVSLTITTSANMTRSPNKRQLIWTGLCAVFTVKIIYKIFMLHIARYDMILHKLDLDVYPEALCMDGSPAAFYHDSHQFTRGDNVIIYLPGGGYCINLEECRERYDF